MEGIAIGGKHMSTPKQRSTHTPQTETEEQTYASL
jgi:hypothetical protein